MVLLEPVVMPLEPVVLALARASGGGSTGVSAIVVDSKSTSIVTKLAIYMHRCF